MNETKNWMIEIIATVIIFILSIILLTGNNAIGGFTFFVIGYLLKEVIMCLIRRMEELYEEL